MFLELINNFVFSMLEGLIILIVLMLFTGNRKFIAENKLKSAIFLLIFGSFAFFAQRYTYVGVRTVIMVLFSTIMLSYISRSSLYASLVTAAASVVLLSVCESVVMIAEMLILKTDLNTLMLKPGLKLVSLSFSKALEFMILFLLLKSKIRIFKDNLLDKGNIFLSFVLFQGMIIGIMFIFFNYVHISKDYFIAFNIIMLVIYLLLVALSYMDYKEREKMLMLKRKYEVQEEHIKNMETVIGVIRKEKHDFANHLNTIQAMCLLRKDGTVDKIDKYIRKLTDNLRTSYTFLNTGNDYVDGLLAVKSSIAFEHGIHMEADLEVSMDMLRIEDNVLTSIIGNIVDNAFEAVNANTGEKGKIVSLYTYVEDEYYYISVSNNGPAIPQELMGKIFEKGFTTKGDGGCDHGYGLYIVKQLAERWKGKVEVRSSEEETEFIVGFPLEKTRLRQAI